jgi:hypothetical protein
MSVFFFVVLPCVGRRLAMGRSPIQGVLSKHLKGLVTEVNSYPDQARGTNP